MSVVIREARHADLDAILSIWLERPGADRGADQAHLADYRRDFAERVGKHSATFRFWVASNADLCVGWSSLQRIRSSPSLKETMAEWSVYVTAESRSKTVGRELAATAIAHARHSDLEWIVGFVAQTNAPCLALFERCGFNQLVRFPTPTGNTMRPEVLVFALDVSATKTP